MSRKFLSLGVLAAAFTLVLGTTDAQARHCHSHHRHNRCCQNTNYGSGNCGNQQVANYGCQQIQQATYVTANTCCAPQATCCHSQPACTTSVTPASFSAPAPQPPVEQAAPAPAPGN